MGSDYLPGIGQLTGCPVVLAKLSTPTSQLTRPFPEEGPVGSNQGGDTLLQITRAHHTATDEININIVSPSDGGGVAVKDNRSYQLGTANFESVSVVIIGIVQNCDEDLQEFDIVRLGPKEGQSSREFFRLDRSTVRMYVIYCVYAL